MKIVSVEPMLIDRYLFVRITTDKGLVGVGESGTWGHLEASAAAIAKFGDYLVGKDPSPIEHHWNVMYRSGHFRGSAIMGAISAIDIALWDIKGKSFGVPVYELLGGKTRTKARVYYHVKGPTIDAQVEKCVEAKEAGYTAVGHLNPFLDEARSQTYFQTHAAKIEGAIENVRRYREAVGNDVDLCLEIHRRLSPAEAIVLGRAIEQYRPMFYEDPILPDNFDAMAEVASQIGIPIATGERLMGIHEFQMLLERRATQYVRICVCVAGGISGAKKIAALAEAHHKFVIPHNPLSPVSTAACLQLDASIPNLAIQELPDHADETPDKDLLKERLRVENGFLLIPEGPGIGVELIDDVREKFPPKPRPVGTRLNVDGSVVDQ
ncbi:MAG: galactonate dehydratase [Chloroflexi bacterium]|nr:galactonate dehydratase [Chloroflexota bacterium]